MKPPDRPHGKQPVNAVSPKLRATGERPGFPLRLQPFANAPVAIKKVAVEAGKTSAPAINGSKYPVRNNQLSTAPALQGKASKAPVLHTIPAGLGMDSRANRLRMVHKLAAQGVSDPQVLAAMSRIERHRFVDTALANQGYEDTSLPIGLGQTISKPNVVARMLELLLQGRPGKTGRVLEIGTGCGYQAAVLGELATEVYSIERLRGLHEKARENLRLLRLPNVHLIFGDGMVGYAKGAPYAAIISAAGGEAIPTAWTDQLAMGGRLVAPLQGANGTQALVVVDKSAKGLRQTLLEPVNFVPLKSGTS